MAHEGNKRWLRKWLRFEPHQIIGGVDNPYLKRWYILPRNRFVNVYLHQFLRSDDDRALHDHPWPFASIILKGAYWEHRADKPLTAASRRTAGTIAFRRPATAHRVELEAEVSDVTGDYLYWAFDDPRRRNYFVPKGNPDGTIRMLMHQEKPVWTIIVTGPRVRRWGFLCPQGWKWWKDFEHDNGCGEE